MTVKIWLSYLQKCICWTDFSHQSLSKLKISLQKRRMTVKISMSYVQKCICQTYFSCQNYLAKDICLSKLKSVYRKDVWQSKSQCHMYKNAYVQILVVRVYWHEKVVYRKGAWQSKYQWHVYENACIKHILVIRTIWQRTYVYQN